MKIRPPELPHKIKQSPNAGWNRAVSMDLMDVRSTQFKNTGDYRPVMV